MRRKWIFYLPLVMAAIALFIFIGGQVVKLLWNWLLPLLFGVREVTFWQALGLLALCRILFGGMGAGRGDSHRRTSEERERFRQRVRERLGLRPRTDVPQ